MDTKALAKSKRAHTQHHTKKYHSNQKPKAPSTLATDAGNDASSASATNKTLGKQIGKKKPKLPSNWDRYDDEEEFDLESEGTLGLNQASSSDVVIPKSEGADYGYLIAEAQSQSQSQFGGCESMAFPLFDDVLTGEWNKGIGSMLSARGESIVSWIGDDSFVVDDKTAAYSEVSFLSLNLHSLAEQLEKVDLSKRLFIEADLLPPELNVKVLESTSNQYNDQVQATSVSQGARVVPEESALLDFSNNIKDAGADQDIEIMTLSSPVSNGLDQSFSDIGSISLNQADVDPSEIGNSTNQQKPPELSVQSSVKSATTAEEELDMLLDSFSETKINESSGFRSVHEEAAVHPFQVPKKCTDSAMTMAAANLDDALDDLINETSITIGPSGPSRPPEKMVVHDFKSSSHAETSSKELDEFDSWFDTL